MTETLGVAAMGTEELGMRPSATGRASSVDRLRLSRRGSSSAATGHEAGHRPRADSISSNRGNNKNTDDE